MRSLRNTFIVTTSQRWTTMYSNKLWMGILPVSFRPSPRALRMLRCVVQDVTQGAPYGTGTLNALTPQFKRIASIQGDWLFQGPRRFLLRHRAHKQNTWSFGTTPSHILICPNVLHSLRSSEQRDEILTRSRFCAC